jgi:hypothetical protein
MAEVFVLLAALFVTAQDAAGPQWKDREFCGEFERIAQERDPAARLVLLDAWKARKNTPFLASLRQAYLATYQQLNRVPDVLRTAHEILVGSPDNLQGLAAICAFAIRLEKPSTEDLNAAERAANRILTHLDQDFAAERKPFGATDALWNAAKTEVQELARKARVWVLTHHDAKKLDPDPVPPRN